MIYWSGIMRKGSYIAIEGGRQAFVPPKLTPSVPVRISERHMALLAEAERALGELNAVWSAFDDPWTLLWLYFRKEAVESSAIEGTQTTVSGLLETEASPGVMDPAREEVANYFAALRAGIEALNRLPVSSRLIRDLHRTLLAGKVRGYWRAPGEFRRQQNFIGGSGRGIEDAAYIPPPPQFVEELMGDLERFINESELPASLVSAIAHAQFELIHPFMDGNGRVGRLLIILILVARGVLRYPAIYISAYFLKNREEYYARLGAISEAGDWDGWTSFFLAGLAESARASIATAERVRSMMREHGRILAQVSPKYASRIARFLLKQPIFTTPQLKEELGIRSAPQAWHMVNRMKAAGLIAPVYSGRRRNILYAYTELIRAFERE